MEEYLQKITDTRLFITSIDPFIIQSIGLFSVYSNWSLVYNQCYTTLQKHEIETIAAIPKTFTPEEWIRLCGSVISRCVRKIAFQLSMASDTRKVTNGDISNTISRHFQKFYKKSYIAVLDEEEEEKKQNKMALSSLTIEDVDRLRVIRNTERENRQVRINQRRRMRELEMEPIEFWMLVFCIYRLDDSKHERMLRALENGDLLFVERTQTKLDEWRLEECRDMIGLMDVEFMVSIMLYNRQE